MNLFQKFLQLISVALFCILLTNCQSSKDNPRKIIDFNGDWHFHLGDVEKGSTPDLDDSNWRKLNVPHDWSIEGDFSKEHPAGVGGGALPGGIGWYRKSFTLSPGDKDKKIFIEFDGIYMNSEVWVNGQHLGKRPNGYISFRYDLTPHVNFNDKENVIAVKVDNSKQPNSRWYSGSGIYRNVRLVITNNTYIDQWGTFVTTPEVNENEASVDLDMKIVNEAASDQTISIKSLIYNDVGEVVAEKITENIVLKDTLHTETQNFTVNRPNLWSPQSPYMYNIITTIESNGNLLDQYATPLGVRKFKFDSENGFVLNGKQTKIKGVCLHHDLGCLGAAINKRAIERRLEILKSMGCNGIRTAHNPPSPELLELCDEMGFIVMDEAFDVWAKGKTEFGYHKYWDEWHERDLKDLVLRDRNHPSIFVWSVGNEILEQWDSTGIEMTKDLVDIVKELDTTRPVTTGCNPPSPSNNVVKSGVLDLIGYNYAHKEYEKFPEVFPDEKFIATETTSALASRGEYDMPSDSIRRWPIRWDKPFTQGNPDHTVSAYDNVSTPWGSTHIETWKIIKKHDYLSGMYIWTGFDYIGEPTPYGWPSRSSYFGIMDLAGFPKDAYYLYKSEWTNDDTVLHVFPHWNWSEGDTVDVWTYSSAPEVELFLNEESLGTKTKDEDDLHLMWRVPYQKGTIKAVSRKDGKVIKEKVVQTAGEPASIVLEPDHNVLKADGKDLSFIKVTVVDENGIVVPLADNLINFDIEGAGTIAGVDNGDQTSHESFKADHRKAYNGLCLVVVQSKDQAGNITINATSEGLQGDDVLINVKKKK